MVFVEWNENFSVHIKEIDNQHKELFQMIERAYELFDSGEKGGELGEIFNKLMEFVRVHFSTEEKYFDQCDYKYKDEHVREHAEYILKAINFKDKFDKGEDVEKSFLDFLREWWLDHVRVHDMKYVKTFKACGLK